MPGLEERYIHHLDTEKHHSERAEGNQTEELVVSFLTASGFETRLSTAAEDEGRTDIGSKQIIDAVSYYEHKPALALQITTNNSKDMREKKLQEIRSKPFLRLEEMKTQDLAIPRALVYINAAKVNKFKDNPDFNQHPELSLQILDSIINSLKFDLAQTKNPLEQKAVTQLIQMMEQEKKKYLH